MIVVRADSMSAPAAQGGRTWSPPVRTGVHATTIHPKSVSVIHRACQKMLCHDIADSCERTCRVCQYAPAESTEGIRRLTVWLGDVPNECSTFHHRCSPIRARRSAPATGAHPLARRDG